MKDRSKDIEMVTEPKAGEKQFRDDTIYYAIGPKISTTEETLFRSGTAPRKIKKSDIETALKGTETVKIFDTQDEARSYAKLTKEIPTGSDPGMAAIILEVRPKKTINLPIERKEESKKISNFSPERETRQFEYVVANIKDLTLISGQVLREKFSLSEGPGEDKSCTIM
ncbi:hypothetical protein ACQUW5_06395 [Legionella sp. CNM-1927-20]|uniref:hypothetical protein n=1 Tax=Legionella sp. CNM-1927-20 TaxID=3422221 RepID=UPI00403AD394